MASERDRKSSEFVSEWGFICRVFYRRGGKRISQLFVEAKSLGASPDWFTEKSCAVIWKAAEELFASPDFSGVTLLTICKKANALVAEDRDLSRYGIKIETSLFEDAAKYTSGDDELVSYAKILQDSLVKRQVVSLMESTRVDIAAALDPTAALSRLASSSQALLQGKDPCHKLSISDLCDQAMAEWEEAYHQVSELGNYEWMPGIPLPWRKLSYVLGGFNPDVTILAARPGVGKTSLAMNFSRYWLDMGYKVAFVSVDMSPIGFVKRNLSERSSISSRKLQFGKSRNWAEDKQRLLEQVSFLKELEKTGRFTLYDEYDVDLIKSTCMILKEQNAIDVLIIDYIQLLTCKSSNFSSAERVEYISKTIHSIANKCQIPILCLSQLNRDSTKDGGREPQASDLKGSGGIEQDAANILLLHREDALYKKWKSQGDPNWEPPVQFAKNRQPNDAIKNLRPITCIVAKSRDGEEGARLPFVVVQNKYAWYLADYEKDGDERFQRVYDDWRHDPVEKIWDENGALIKMADVRAAELINLNARRAKDGLPPLSFSNPQSVASGQAASESFSFQDKGRPPAPSSPASPSPTLGGQALSDSADSLAPDDEAFLNDFC